MKRWIMVLGIVLLGGAIAIPVLAHGPTWGRGDAMTGYWSGGPGYGWHMGYGPLPEGQQNKFYQLNQQFYSDTANLRNEMWTKSRELDNLLSGPNPDSQRVRALQKEVSDLRAKLDEKRVDYELEARKIDPGSPVGMGYGRGYGPRMGYDYGPGACWQ